jgi:glutathione peroxidase
MMQKVEVNGEHAHSLFKWLKAQAPGLLNTEAIKWNFTKFLVARNGQVLKRFAPQDSPASLTKEIEQSLAAAH